MVYRKYSYKQTFLYKKTVIQKISTKKLLYTEFSVEKRVIQVFYRNKLNCYTEQKKLLYRQFLMEKTIINKIFDSKNYYTQTIR